MEKQKLRQNLLKLRQSLTLTQVITKSNQITRLILKNFFNPDLTKVFLYVPVQNEVNTWPLIKYFWQKNIQVLLPKCDPKQKGKMQFYQVTNKDQLIPGKFGILEPDPKKCPVFTLPAPQLIFLPGLGFDLKKYRLGYGGGYYDRLLAHPDFAQTTSIGLSFAIQIVEKLPTEPWDKPVRFVVTEDKVY